MAKFALLIGVSQYEQASGLAQLPSAVRDVQSLKQILLSADMGGFEAENVVALEDPERQLMEEAIENLFSGRNKDDLVLLFFSGHGIKDDSGRLFLSSRKTLKNQRGELMRSTAVSSGFVQDSLSRSRSRRQVVILDCCFSGAFAEGLSAKDDGSVDIRMQLGGEGRAVLTSSTSTQYSFEQEGADLSAYTKYLIEGIRSGIADEDGDGQVAIDELHEYAKRKVQETFPTMKPEIYTSKEGFKIFVAKAPANDPKLKYRREVERVAERGVIYGIARKTLDWQRIHFGLLPEEATEIENEVLKPHREYRNNLQQYEQAFLHVLEKENPIAARTRKDLKRFQEVLALRDEDISPVEERVLKSFQNPGDVSHTAINSSDISVALDRNALNDSINSQAQASENQNSNERKTKLVNPDVRISPDKSGSDSRGSKQESSSRKAVPNKPHKLPSRLLLGTGIALGIAACIGGIFAYSHLKTVREMKSKLDEIYVLRDQGNYKECETQALQVPPKSRFFEEARQLEEGCRTLMTHQSHVEEAKIAAEGGEYMKAIQDASKVPSSSPLYGSVEALIPEWVQRIIVLATQTYNSGNEDEAYRWLSNIPEGVPGYDEAQAKLEELKIFFSSNLEYQEAADIALNAGNFNAALEAANQIDPSTPFWQGEQNSWIARITAAQESYRLARENEQRMNCEAYRDSRIEYLREYQGATHSSIALIEELRESHLNLSTKYESINEQCSNLDMEIRDVPDVRF